jgi:hypothetical protein
MGNALSAADPGVTLGRVDVESYAFVCGNQSANGSSKIFLCLFVVDDGLGEDRVQWG